jgi:hypothetical protein
MESEMPDKFGWDNNFGNNPAPTRHQIDRRERAMKRISFGRSKPWSDRMGKHTVIDIRDRGTVIGKITGESGVGIPMMQYTVECAGIRTFTSYSLKDAKTALLTHVGANAAMGRDAQGYDTVLGATRRSVGKAEG